MHPPGRVPEPAQLPRLPQERLHVGQRGHLPRDPRQTELRDGDIVNLDVTIFLDGMHGDTNATFLVGTVDERSRRLVQVTRECLDAPIAAVGPDGP